KYPATKVVSVGIGDTTEPIREVITSDMAELAAPPVMLVPADVGFFVFNQLAAPVEVIGKAAVELKLKKSAAKLICMTSSISLLNKDI
ncbi:hypothetical protein Tco_1290373, partial [Tanacetum coccineum]